MEHDNIANKADVWESLRNASGYLYADLLSSRAGLLETIKAWRDCPASYRGKLYARFDRINISDERSHEKLDVLIQEIAMIEFHLQLNPTWIRGLHQVVDEIINQTKREQREGLILEFSSLKEQLSSFKNNCKTLRSL